MRSSPSPATRAPAPATATHDTSASTRAARVAWLPLAALVLLAALLRFPTLTTQSIWFDEAATWELMRLPFGEMLRALPDRESNPPLFYILEWGWTRAFGDREWGLRSLSALAGTLLVPIAYRIGRRIGGRRAGLATAALVAVNPLLVWFSQEARSYELVALLSACALLAFLRALDDARPAALALWAAAAALALCSHYFAAFVLAPQAAWLLWRHPRRVAAVSAGAALVAVGLALLPLLLAQRANPYDIADSSLAVRVLQVPKQFVLGYRGPLAVATGVVAAALVAGGLWLLVRRTEGAARARALSVCGIGLGGVALPLTAALLGADYLNARNVIPALVPLAAALGTGFAAGRSPRAVRGGTALLVTLCSLSIAIVAATAADPQYQRPDWKGLARGLGVSDEARVLVISPADGELALRFYRRGLRRLADAGAHVRAVDVVGVATAPGPGDAPALPAQHGASFPPELYTFGPPRRTGTATWVRLRYRQPRPTLVQPLPISSVRFSELPPSVALLPGER